MKHEERKKVIIKSLMEELELPKGAYETAKKRYEDLGEWFNRDQSSLREYEPHIFSQGSFRLGTAIKPLKDEEYDLDIACKLTRGISKGTHTQKDLKHKVRHELELYRQARNIKKELEEKHRCWRAYYMDSMSFHMDVVPCIPESEGKRHRIYDSLRKYGSDESVAKSRSDLTVSITDDRDENYGVISDDWKISNPEGYAQWFEATMKKAMRFDLLEKRAQVDDVPLYKRKTPLQRVIQLLKKHRDIMFQDDTDSKPISIIITTLSASAYSGEQDFFEALSNILDRMGGLVNSSSPRVPNPVDPEEDFADRWGMEKYRHLNLENNFWQWLSQAKSDLQIISDADDPAFISKQAQQKFGIRLDENELEKSLGKRRAPAVIMRPKHHEIEDEHKPWSFKP